MRQTLNVNMNKSGTQNTSQEGSEGQSFYLNPEKYKKDVLVVCKKNE
jgi:hypothetical protein